MGWVVAMEVGNYLYKQDNVLNFDKLKHICMKVVAVDTEVEATEVPANL